MLVEPLRGRASEGAPRPFLFTPQPTFEFVDHVLIDLLEVFPAVEPVVVVRPATQNRCEPIRECWQRCSGVVTDRLANPLANVIHRFLRGKPIAELLCSRSDAFASIGSALRRSRSPRPLLRCTSFQKKAPTEAVESWIRNSVGSVPPGVLALKQRYHPLNGSVSSPGTARSSTYPEGAG